MKRNINLLPPDNQQQLKLARLNSEVLSFGIWLILSLLVFITVLFAAWIVTRSRLEGTTEQIAQQTKVLNELKQASVRREAEAYNQNLSNFQVLQKAHENWFLVLAELARRLPSDLVLDSFIMNRTNKKVEISGNAASRDSVLKFRQNLLASPYFTNVNFPLSNLEQPKNLVWKYKFYVKPGPLK